MGLLDSVLNVQITKGSKAPTRAGFGTPLLMVYHTVTAKRIAYYTSPKALLDDGFPLTHPAYRMAVKAFSQPVAPKRVAVGKRSVGTTQVVKLTPKNTTQGFHYQFSVVDYLGVSTDLDYIVPGSASVATVVAGLVALLGSVVSVTVASVGSPATDLTLTSTTAGRLFNLTNLPNPDDLAVKNTSADPGIAADLTAVADIDSRGWYGIALDSSSKAEAVAAAAWAEANYRKLLSVNSSDSEIADNAVTNDAFSTLKAANYARTFGLYSQTELLSYSALAWMANRLPYNPGRAMWAYVTLSAVTVDNLKDGQILTISGVDGTDLAKCGNVYAVLAGNGSTLQGVTFAGEWIDITIGTDWLHARLQERVIGAIQAAANSGTKIPYTEKGVALVKALVEAQLREAVSPQFALLADSPAPTVTVPSMGDINPLDKQARTLNGVEFAGTYAGAIQNLTLLGSLSY